jgi:hypothetical protein
MATSDDIARRIAERVAHTTDPALPACVERALAEGDDDEDEAPPRPPARPVAKGAPPNPTVRVARLASFVVSVAELTWSIFKDERDRAERRAAEAKPAASLEVAHLRRLVEGRLGTAVDVPRMLPPQVRVAVVEIAAEEAVAAGQRIRDR